MTGSRIVLATTVVALAFMLSGCGALLVELAEVGALGRLAAGAELGVAARGLAAAELGSAARGLSAAELGGPRGLGSLRGPGMGTSLDIGGVRILPATEAELRSLQNLEPELRPVAARNLVLARSLSDVQLNSLLAIDTRAFSGLRVGQRIYAAIEDGARTEAGWLRKVDTSTIHFSDGRVDLVKSELTGNAINHYSLRLGHPTPLARTILQNAGKRLLYQAWVPETNAYATVGYGDLSPTGSFIDIFSTENRYLGRLRYSSVGRTNLAQLPQPTISNGIVETVATAVLLARFEPAFGILPGDKCMATPQGRQQASYPGGQELLSIGGAQYRLVVMPLQGEYTVASPDPSCAPTVTEASETHYRIWRQVEDNLSQPSNLPIAPIRSGTPGDVVGSVVRYDDIWNCVIVALSSGKLLQSGQLVTIGAGLRAQITRAQGASACATPDYRPNADISGSPVFSIQ